MCMYLKAEGKQPREGLCEQGRGHMPLNSCQRCSVTGFMKLKELLYTSTFHLHVLFIHQIFTQSQRLHVYHSIFFPSFCLFLVHQTPL